MKTVPSRARPESEKFTLAINADLTTWDQPADNPHT